MKFMSNAAVFIVIAAFAAGAANAGESASDEQPGASLQRHRRNCMCNNYGCICCPGGGASCGPNGCFCGSRLKREELATLNAAIGVSEDAAPIGDNGESADDEQPGASLQRRRRSCICPAHLNYCVGEDCWKQGGCVCPAHLNYCTGGGCWKQKREDLATLNAAIGVSEDAAPVGDNGESAGDEQSGVSLRRRLRGCHCGPYGCICCPGVGVGVCDRDGCRCTSSPTTPTPNPQGTWS